MKKILLFTQILTSICITGLAQINNTILFDVNFNNDYNDHSEYNLVANINGTVSPDTNRFGFQNTAIRFDGDPTTYLNFGIPSHLKNDQPFTVSLWFKGGSILLGDYEMLMHKYNLGIGLYDVNTPLIGGIWDNDWNGNSYDWSNNKFHPDYDSTSWHHIVVKKDADSIHVYRDNILIGKKTDYSTIWSDGDSILIGKNFEGVIDEVFIFQGALSDQEITYLFEKSDDLITDLNYIDNKIIYTFYPNPVIDYLYLEEDSDIKVYNISGTKLLDIKNTSNLSLDNLRPGLYLIKINGNKIQKLVKK
jgi:hypothetical protein